MNTLTATIVHKYFKEQFFTSFSVMIEKSHVLMERADRPNAITVSIKGRKAGDDLKGLFFEIIDLLFLYLGSCPAIEKLTVNSEEIDNNSILFKYHPSRKYGQLLSLCDLSSDTINEAAIKKCREFERTPFFSLEYILSAEYDDINIVHRFVLLLHVIEGIVTDAQRDGVRIELQKLAKKQGSLGNHLPSVYFICKNGFFNYHKNYNCEILTLLRTSRYGFIKRATDTRNWYSHFLNDKRIQNSPNSARREKKLPLTDGADMSASIFMFFRGIQRARLSRRRGISPPVAFDFVRDRVRALRAQGYRAIP